MKSKWSDVDAAQYVAEFPGNEDLALRVYTSRLIGREPTLVLHGGGNTSVKTRMEDDTGDEVDVLCVKGSGWDLGDIAPAGLPAVRLGTLAALRMRASLSDEDMVNAQRTRLLDASSPNPSVETLLHAFLPAKFIDHSHADAILALVDQPEAERIAREVFGDTLAIVPYVMPGFALAKLAAEVQAAHPDAEGLLLLKHGLFTWGATARESYERHVAAVTKAEAFIAKHRQTTTPGEPPPALDYATVAPILRGLLGPRLIFDRRTGPTIERYLSRPDLADVSQRGVPTPDHVIRTRRVPLLLDLQPSMDEDAMRAHVSERLAAYRDAYRRYVREQAAAKKREVRELDPDPRVALVPGLGLIGMGPTPKAARVAADLHEHCVDVIEAAEAVGRYEVLPLGDLFDMEYWSLEQAKLGKKKPGALEGQVVLISGAASGIGAACARAFGAAGAPLFLVDRDEEGVRALAEELGAGCAVVDVRDPEAVRASVEACVARYGGIDGVISNAGVAAQGAMHDVSDDAFRDSFEINFFSHHVLAAAATRVMRQQGRGGFLLFNASKAAFNPGPGFGPYAVPKAAIVALMKQYALDNGRAGIRSNAVNADRVRTGMFPPAFVQERAAARGLEPDEYFKSNLLAREVRAEDVARAMLDLALAPATTGCVITVDGGNIAASPR